VIERRGLACLLAWASAWLGCGDMGPGPATEAPPAAAHLLLVTVDTLRADHLGCYGGTLDLTPQIDALAAESVRFTAAYSPAPFTLPAVGALMTGRYPEAVGLRHNLSRLSPGMSTLAAQLRERGFETAAVVSNPVLAARSRLDRGFDRYDAAVQERETNRAAAERGARATTDAALEVLSQLGAGRESPAPFFLWVHYQDPHGPYTPPGALRESYLEAARMAPDGARELPALAGWRGQGGIPAYQFLTPRREAAWYRAGYAGEVRHVDDEVGRLLRGLRERGLSNQTTIVFTADHGEALGERDYWFAHGEHLDDPAIRVPLLVRAPGLAPGRRDETASLVDVLPTVSGLLGSSLDLTGVGVDLFSTAARERGRAVYASTNEFASSRALRAIVADGFKLVRDVTGESRTERLFRLPDEQTDLGMRDPQRRGALSDALDVLTPQARRHEGAGSDPAPTAAEIEQLRALGYVVEEPR
jgi:arylsulfatase